MFYKMPSKLKISLMHTLVSILIDRLLNSEGNSRTVCMHVFIFFLGATVLEQECDKQHSKCAIIRWAC